MLKKYALPLYSFFFLLFVIIESKPAFSAEKLCFKPLVLSSTIDWYPYIYREKEISKGADVELLQLILKQMGCELDVLHFPERRSLLELEKGNFDIWLGASRNKEREKKYNFSKAYRFEINRFVYQSRDVDVKKITSLQDLIRKNKTIAINLAGWYGEDLESAKTQSDLFIHSDTVSKRIKMLSVNRVDIVIDDSVVLCHELARLPSDGLAIHPLILYQTPIHFIFNKKTVSSAFIERFNKILAELSGNGGLKRHFDEHLPVSCE